MNPFFFVLRVSALGLISAAVGAVVLKKLAPKSSDLVAGAVHIRNGVEEFCTGVSTIFFGRAGSSSDRTRRDKKESSRIPID